MPRKPKTEPIAHYTLKVVSAMLFAGLAAFLTEELRGVSLKARRAAKPKAAKQRRRERRAQPER